MPHSIDQFASSTAVPYSTIRPAIFSASPLAAAREGFEVAVCPTGPDALDAFDRNGDMPHSVTGPHLRLTAHRTSQYGPSPPGIVALGGVVCPC